MSDTTIDSKKQLIRFLKDRKITPKMTLEQTKTEFNNYREMCGTDLTALIDTVLITNPEARQEFNRSMESYCLKNNVRSFVPVQYSALASDLLSAGVIDEELYKRSATAMDIVTTPGFAGSVQTTVADFILRTVGQLGNIWSEVRKVDLRNRGNFNVPVYSGNNQSQFRADELANYASANSEIEGAMTNITLNPKSFGKTISTSTMFENVLSGIFLAEVVQILIEGQVRSKDGTTLNGTGVNQPVGMNLNALSGTVGNPTVNQFKIGGNLVETVLNASAKISTLRKAGKNRQVLFCNSIFESNLLAEKFSMTNSDLAQFISVKDGQVNKVGGIRVVVNDEVIMTDASNNSIGTLALPEFYIWGTTKPDEMSEDRQGDFKASILVSKIEGIADGKPGFNNAFAKINSNNT